MRRADTGELIAGGSLAVARTSPALFATLLNENNSLNSASAPAVKGGTIQIFGVGQGEVSPAVADGAPASGSPLSSTVAQATTDGAACVSNPSAMCVVIGNSFAEVLFSGLTPGLVGVWQINARVPANAPSGAVPVRVVINGTRSNGISVNIK